MWERAAGAAVFGRISMAEREAFLWTRKGPRICRRRPGRWREKSLEKGLAALGMLVWRGR
jgi:hypothetical protein